MRVVKKREIRRSEILDVAETLFNANGFDATSTSQIIENASIARGTLYHHFPSKGAIVDALVERMNARILSAAETIEKDTSRPALERLIAAVQALNVDNHGGRQLRRHIHKPGNALMHEKIQEGIVANVTPVLSAIVEDGVREGVFSTPYPYETMRMIVVYVNNALDDNALAQLEPEHIESRMKALVYNIARLLGDDDGTLATQLARLLAGPDEAASAKPSVDLTDRNDANAAGANAAPFAQTEGARTAEGANAKKGAGADMSTAGNASTTNAASTTGNASSTGATAAEATSTGATAAEATSTSTASTGATSTNTASTDASASRPAGETHR